MDRQRRKFQTKGIWYKQAEHLKEDDLFPQGVWIFNGEVVEDKARDIVKGYTNKEIFKNS